MPDFQKALTDGVLPQAGSRLAFTAGERRRVDQPRPEFTQESAGLFSHKKRHHSQMVRLRNGMASRISPEYYLQMPSFLLTAGDDARDRANARVKGLGQFLTRIREAADLLRSHDKAALDAAYPETMNNMVFADGEFDETFAVLFHYGRHMREFGGDLPRLLNYSLIIQVYTCFEEVACDLCAVLAERNPAFGPFRKPKQAIFMRIKKYLELEAKFVFPLWAELDSYRKLRNKIVHSGGRIPAEDAGEFKVLFPAPHELHIYEEGLVHPNRTHVERFFTLVDELFEAIYAQFGFGPLSSFSPEGPFDGGLIVSSSADGQPPEVTIISSEDRFDVLQDPKKPI